MFDNPKKELERLEQQLLAAEAADTEDEEFDGPYDDNYSEFDMDGAYDDELRSMLHDADMSDREFARRSAGFDVPDEEYEMDADRYVPAPKKKGIGGLLIIAILEAGLAIALIAWLLERLT